MTRNVVCAICAAKTAPEAAPKRGSRAVSFLAVLAFFTLIGCSTAVKETDFSLRYPPFPDEPRFAYITSYYGEGDREYLGFLEILLGSTKPDVLQKPVMAVSRGDILYIAVNGEKSIAAIDTVKNKFSTITAGTPDYHIQFLAGLAVSAAGNIYFSDALARVVYMTDNTGSLIKIIGEKILADPFAIALDEKNERMYVSDRKNHAVHAFSMTTGDLLFTIGKPGSNDGEFQYPQGVAVDRRNGHVLVADTDNFKIQIFDDKGVFLRKWGEAGDGAGSFARIAGLAVDSEGHIYVSDVFKHKVLIFDEEGRALMDLGGPGGPPGYFQIPMGISIDEQDRLYVADLLNGRVQVFQYLSDAWKKDHPEEYKKYQEKPVETQKPKKPEKEREIKITH